MLTPSPWETFIPLPSPVPSGGEGCYGFPCILPSSSGRGTGWNSKPSLGLLPCFVDRQLRDLGQVYTWVLPSGHWEKYTCPEGYEEGETVPKRIQSGRLQEGLALVETGGMRIRIPSPSPKQTPTCLRLRTASGELEGPK